MLLADIYYYPALQVQWAYSKSPCCLTITHAECGLSPVYYWHGITDALRIQRD